LAIENETLNTLDLNN